MVLPKLLSLRASRRSAVLPGALMTLLLAATAWPAGAADGGPLLMASIAPRSRLHVQIPGYEEYYEAWEVPAREPVLAPSRIPQSRSGVAGGGETGFAGPVASLPSPAIEDGAVSGLVIGYAPGSAGVPAAAEPSLQALALRMRQDPTMVVALEGFAGGTDSLKARRLALWRARAVRSRLIEDGVAGQRIRLRAAQAEAGSGAMERVDVRAVAP